MSTIAYIHDKTEKIVRKAASRDPFEICRSMQIRVHYKDLGTVLKAYYFYQSRIRNIVINSRSGMTVRRILCAHELGHAVLHGELAAMRGFQELELFDRSAPAEYEANLFAAEPLISDEELLPLLNDRDKSFFSIAKELYVPAELLDFKFRLLKTRGLRMESPLTSPADFLKKELPECFEPEYSFEGA